MITSPPDVLATVPTDATAQPGCPCTAEIACFNRTPKVDPRFPSEGPRHMSIEECEAKQLVPGSTCPLDCSKFHTDRGTGACWSSGCVHLCAVVT